MKLRNLTFYILHFAFYISMAQTAPWDALRGGVHVVTNEQDAAAMARIVSATNDIAVKMSELRSDNAAAIAASTNGIPAQIAAATNGLPERMESMIPNLAPYALKSELPDIPDLSPYALKSELPEVPDLSPYATKYELGLATNGIPARIAAATNGIPAAIAAATNGIPEAIASATNGIPARIEAATNALEKSLAPAIATTSNALAQATADLAQKVDGLAMAAADSNATHRLMSPDGGTYQDATGTVWRLRHLMAPGLFRLDTVQYYTNGVIAAETNELPGVAWTLWEGYDNGAWEMVAGESGKEEDVGECYREWRDFTNHVAAADMEDMTKFYYLAQLVVAGEEYELQYDGGISESQITFEWPMTEPYKTRFLNFSRTNVTASVWTPADQVLYASSGGGECITTNDVCNIVTNTTPLTLDWKFSGPGIVPGVTYAVTAEWYYNEDIEGYEGDIYLSADGSDIDGPYTTPSDPNVAGFSYYFESAQITATRISLPTRNSLGLARLIDIPPLTNGLPEAIAAKASTNDVLLTPVYSQTPTYSEWVCEPAEYDGVPFSVVDDGAEGYYWMLVWGASVYAQGYSDSTSLTWHSYSDMPSVTATRTRTDIIGYTHGTQINKVLASTSITNGLASAGSVAAASAAASAAQTMAAAASNYTARVDAELSAISNRAPAVVDTGLGVRWVLKATNGVIYAEVEQQ